MAAICFVHIGDCHMGPTARNADRWRAIDRIIAEHVDLMDVAAWLIPGDLNHARMTIEDRNAWTERLRLMAGTAPVVIVYGNHDLPGDLDVFARLAAEWPIHVVSSPRVLQIVLATGRTASIFCLPYPTEAGLVSAGVAPGEIVPTARQALDAIFMEKGAQLDAARALGHITLMVGHVNVSGAIVSTGQPNIGREIELDEALLARLGDCYKGLNHIHKAQSIGGAHYPGSICRLDWGEIEPKGYIVLEVEDLKPGYAPTKWGYYVTRQPLDVAPMYHVEGELTRDGFTYLVKAGPDGAGQEKPTRECEACGGSGDGEKVPGEGTGQCVPCWGSGRTVSWRGCEVRVRYKFQQSEKGLLESAKTHMYADFADAKQPVAYDPVVVLDGGLRAPEVAAAKTLVEKVVAWATETKTTLPESVLDALPELEHTDPEALVAAERRCMDSLLNQTTQVVEPENAEAVA